MKPDIERASQTSLVAICVLALLGFSACGRSPDPSDGARPSSNPQIPAALQPENPTGLPQGSRRVDRAVILDNGGFDEPMVAGTLFVPHGWQTEGGVVWGNDYACTNGYALAWQAQAPGGEAGMAYLPQRGWGWNRHGSAQR